MKKILCFIFLCLALLSGCTTGQRKPGSSSSSNDDDSYRPYHSPGMKGE